MRPERTDGTSGGGLLVPMAWMYAEYIADRMMSVGDLMRFGSVEYRSGREALTLTLFLVRPHTDLFDLYDEDQLDSWLHLTGDPQAWYHWVDGCLPDSAARFGGSDAGAAETAMAMAAWRWLRTTELLPPHGVTPSASRPLGEFEAIGSSWVPAWDLGITLAHLAVQYF